MSPKPSSGGSGLSTGVLTAIIVSAVVVVLAVIAAIIVIRRTSNESGSGSRRLAPGVFSGAAPSNRLLSCSDMHAEMFAVGSSSLHGIIVCFVHQLRMCALRTC